MSKKMINIPCEVWDADLSIESLKFYVQLLNNVSENGFISMSNSDYVATFGLSDRQIRRRLDELRTANLIKINDTTKGFRSIELLYLANENDNYLVTTCPTPGHMVSNTWSRDDQNLVTRCPDIVKKWLNTTKNENYDKVFILLCELLYEYYIINNIIYNNYNLGEGDTILNLIVFINTINPINTISSINTINPFSLNSINTPNSTNCLNSINKSNNLQNSMRSFFDKKQPPTNLGSDFISPNKKNDEQLSFIQGESNLNDSPIILNQASKKREGKPKPDINNMPKPRRTKAENMKIWNQENWYSQFAVKKEDEHPGAWLIRVIHNKYPEIMSITKYLELDQAVKIREYYEIEEISRALAYLNGFSGRNKYDNVFGAIQATVTQNRSYKK